MVEKVKLIVLKEINGKGDLKLNDFKKQINQFQRIDSIYKKFKETEETR